MKTYLAVTLVLISTSAFSQRIRERVWNRDSTIQRGGFYFDLPSVESTKYKTHIRISMLGHIVDLYSKGGKYFQGTLVNHITQYISTKKKEEEYAHTEPKKEYYQHVPLNPELATTVAGQILHSGQPQFPTDSLIPNWADNFLHCAFVSFSFNVDGTYHQLSFHCPWGQNDSIPYKNTVVSNYDLVRSAFELDSSYKKFIDLLPKGQTYAKDGYRMMYKFTETQSEAWAKTLPQREHLKAMKDTIDFYLNVALAKSSVPRKNIDCFHQFFLTFDKKGRIKEIEVPRQPKLFEPYYFEERREVKKCSRLIKALFRDVDLSFLNLKYEFYREISFGMYDEVTLRDNTIY